MTTFEKLLDGLRLYEVISLICGSLLFIVLLIILCILVAQKRSIKPIALFFGIAVIMLVWPSIQKFSIDGTGASMEKETKAYANNPTPENKLKIENAIAELKDKNVSDPEVVTNIAKAQYAIGKDKEAERTIVSLPPAVQETPAVSNLKKSVLVSAALKNQIKLVEQQPADTAAVAKLNVIQKKAETLPNKSVAVEKNISIANKKVSSFRARKMPEVEN